MAIKRIKYAQLIDYYFKAAFILKDKLPTIPCVWLSDATSYYGSAYRKNGKVHSIALSVKTCWPIKHEELLNTLAHELAHVVCFDHCEEHTNLTERFELMLTENWG